MADGTDEDFWGSMCDPAVVNAPVPPVPAPRLVVGGTRARDVGLLRRALAEVLGASLAARPDGGAGSSRRAAGPKDREAAGSAEAAIVERSTTSAPADAPLEWSLLVPIGPDEDPAVVRADLVGRLDDVSERTDLILRTSGSTTGTGSLVAMSASALAASARAAHSRLGGPGTWVLTLPAHHVAGLQVLVRSLLAGTRPVVVDTAGGFKPGALTSGLERALASAAGGPVYVPLVPTQLLRVLDEPPAAAVLARASAVLVGGAAADPRMLARARTAGIRVVTTYGMSETAGGCVYDGVPLKGVSVRIEGADDDGAGRIVLAGPVLAEGYAGVSAAGAPTGTAAPTAGFRARLRELATADRGRLETLPDGSSRLVVLGRLDDVIVTGGLKVDPHEVERVLAALPGVAAVCVVGVPDETWGNAVVAAVVPRAGDRLDAEGVRALARARLDGVRAPKRVLVVDALPLRGPGKVDRRSVAALLARA